MVVAAAQLDVAPPAVLSVKKRAGPSPETAGAGDPKLRLFVSAVKPCATHMGAAVPPLKTLTLGMIDAPLLKLAWPPPSLLPPLPKMLNSAIVHPAAAFTALSPVTE
jgi:hypothetical protein